MQLMRMPRPEELHSIAGQVSARASPSVIPTPVISSCTATMRSPLQSPMHRAFAAPAGHTAAMQDNSRADAADRWTKWQVFIRPPFRLALRHASMAVPRGFFALCV
jgi:hypothetical protein